MPRAIRNLAVITGATGGIGAAVALRLASNETHIIAHYATNHERARILRADVEARGGQCTLVQSDLGSEEGISVLTHVVARIVADPSIDLLYLVNSAAKLLGPSLRDATPEDFDEYFALNVKAPFFLVQRLAPLMAAGGSIVNISSAGAHFSSPGDIVYAMSKAALESLTTNAAEALAADGIRINTVVPGFTDNGHEAFQIPSVRDYLSTFSVLGGVSEPETVADAVCFLLSSQSSRTTGSALDVSGGSMLAAKPRGGFSLREVKAKHERAI